jgi:hypothetical protein
MFGIKLATIGTIVTTKNAGKKHNPRGSTHLIDSERTRRRASLTDCARVNINSSSSDSEIGPPVVSDRDIVFKTDPSFGYFSAVYPRDLTKLIPKLHLATTSDISPRRGSVEVSITRFRVSSFVSPALMPSRKISMNSQMFSEEISLRLLWSNLFRNGKPK